MNQNKPSASTQSGEGRASPSEDTAQGPSTGSGAGSDGQSTSPSAAYHGPFTQPTPPSDSDDSYPFTGAGRPLGRIPETDVSKPFGQMTISKNEVSYRGEAHWAAILDSIADLKRDLGEEENDEDEVDEDPAETRYDARPDGYSSLHGPPSTEGSGGLSFMLGIAGTPGKATKQQLISSVPPKPVVDRLLNLWFNSPDPFKPCVHAPTFQDEYRRFWREPNSTPTMWLGILFAIMSLASSFGLRDSDPSSEAAQKLLSEVNTYHSLSASAAVLADFTKPRAYTLECLILYAGGLRSNNAFVNVWLMIGLIVRLALRMGYHRDPSHYGNITPFQGEMRRRVWCGIYSIDVLISFQLGLPSMIRSIQSDTQPPGNFLDRDFGVSSTVLPIERPVTEWTPSSYTRTKLNIITAFAKAAELSSATVAPSYEEVLGVDTELEAARAAVPPHLRMLPMEDLVTDQAEQLMCRFNVDLLYLKTKCVLHRRYMTVPLKDTSPEEQEIGISASRKVCIEAAMQTLRHHHTIYAASQPGGQLEAMKWYMGSISTHDFLLAAMVICLELSQQIGPGEQQINPNAKMCPTRKPMMDALEQSQRIWAETSEKKNAEVERVKSQGSVYKAANMYDETEKASKAMGVMLERVKKHFPASFPLQHPPDSSWNRFYYNGTKGDKLSAKEMDARLKNGPTPFHGVVSNWDWSSGPDVPDLPSLEQSRSAAGGNSNASTSNAVPNDSVINTSNSSPDMPNDFSMIGDMLDVPLNLDWSSWDNGILGAPQQQDQNQLWPDPISNSDYFMPGMWPAGGYSNGNTDNSEVPAKGNLAVQDMTFDDLMTDVDFSADAMLNYNKYGTGAAPVPGSDFLSSPWVEFAAGSDKT